MTTKTVDSRGRLLLGREYAGRMVIVDDTEPDRLVITPAVAIPEREAWLYRNPEALASVRRGLEQASKHDFVEGPALAADAKLIAQMDD